MSLCLMWPGTNKIMSPYAYMRAYSYPNDLEDSDDDDWEPVFNDRDREIISQFDHIPLLRLEPLLEVWPQEFEIQDTIGQSELPNRACASSTPKPSKLLSLVDLALDAALKHCIEDEDGWEHLEHVANVAGANTTILAHLKDRPSFSTGSFALLRKLLRLEKAPSYPRKINLSGYRLTAQQLNEILDPPQGVEELDISFNSAITKAGLLSILPSHPHLKLLNLVETALSNEDVSSLLWRMPSILHHVQCLIHPILTNPEQTLDASLTVHLGHVASTAPLISSDAAIQMIWNFLEFSIKPTLGDHVSLISRRIC
ncbi:hypothetical protein BKA70DRAFT_604076 [Coprinopsis sp. MPI-PUGE-AT-0042]|nr:hypothetical protein BKA70DRAFT_604076 [Coprinopsis sp. MPI-PUGE-AT-0042]